MILAHVWYELFDWEAKRLDESLDSEYVELNMQLRLEMADGAVLHVAWHWGLFGSDYYVDFRQASFCTGPAEVVREASASSLWSCLVGRPVNFVFRGEDRQVLEIRSDESVVYCCSFGKGMWGMDVLRISKQLPGPLSAHEH